MAEITSAKDTFESVLFKNDFLFLFFVVNKIEQGTDSGILHLNSISELVNHSVEQVIRRAIGHSFN